MARSSSPKIMFVFTLRSRCLASLSTTQVRLDCNKKRKIIIEIAVEFLSHPGFLVRLQLSLIFFCHFFNSYS